MILQVCIELGLNSGFFSFQILVKCLTYSRILSKHWRVARQHLGSWISWMTKCFNHWRTSTRYFSPSQKWDLRIKIGIQTWSLPFCSFISIYSLLSCHQSQMTGAQMLSICMLLHFPRTHKLNISAPHMNELEFIQNNVYKVTSPCQEFSDERHNHVSEWGPWFSWYSAVIQDFLFSWSVLHLVSSSRFHILWDPSSWSCSSFPCYWHRHLSEVHEHSV